MPASASETASPITTRPSLVSTDHPTPSASRRRDKPQLSCNFCRRRKSRCDRQQPCARCLSRNQTCTYAENQTATLSPAGDRFAQLENLVMTLMRESSNNANRPVPAIDLDSSMDERSECGSMSVSASELRYVGSDHWAAILDKIADLKDHFDQETPSRVTGSPDQVQEDNGDSNNNEIIVQSPHALLLYGCSQATSRAEILGALPPRSAVDRYISRYFNQLELVASAAVHGPSFLQEYEEFWINPSGTPVMWIGLLFSMICLAVLASNASDFTHGNETEQQALQINLYREKIVQCLIMGEYTKAGPFVLETVIHYIYVEFGIRNDANKDVWFLLGLEVNLAMRMGYHRDPRHFPGISPLRGEMRRRMWATVLLSDILISSQMGMPRMISESQCDTDEPRNLNDADLDEDITELPPSRPETENTTALGIIARRRMLMALGTISDITDAVKPCNYAEVMRVDSILHEAATNIPPPLKMKNIAASVTDSAQVIMARLFIRHLFYKGQIRLHRRFLYMESTSKDEDSFAYSRRACLDASLGTFQIQHVLEEETCPGGQLHAMRWRVTSSMNHQFLTATMILCSLLYRKQTLNREEEITAALRRTREVWIRRSSSSREAKKAAETVSIVLAKARDGREYQNNHSSEKTGGVVEDQGAESNNWCTTNGNDSEISFDDNRILRNPLGLYEYEYSSSLCMERTDDIKADNFDMPDLLGNFSSTNQQNLNFTFDFNSMERDLGLDEWLLMNGSGTSW